MSKIYLVAALTVAVVAGSLAASTTADAAGVGPFSPQVSQMPGAAAPSSGGLQLAEYRHGYGRGNWGRRCYRECYRGHYGRMYCTWNCYRPRRWW